MTVKTRSMGANGNPVPWNDIPENCMSHEEIEYFVVEILEEGGIDRAGALAYLEMEFGLDPVAYEEWNVKRQALRERMLKSLQTREVHKAPAQQRAEEAWGTEEA